jgi:hypothetical protein
MTDDRINYLRVPCRIVQVTRDAVLINAGDQHWIPLSLLHTLDERALTRGERMTILRIVDWKVQALGLPTERTT